MNERLLDWIRENKLDIKAENNWFEHDSKCFLLIEPKEDKIIDKDGDLILSEEDIQSIEQLKVDYLVFRFGGAYYFSAVDITKPAVKAQFKDFKNLGKAVREYDFEFIHLGVHSEYELLNGSHSAKDWIKKALFFQHNTLAICDKDTLAGTLSFQIACQSSNIKSILGETITVCHNYSPEDEHHELSQLKLYVVNKQGWQDLLKINKAINVDYAGFIPEDLLLCGFEYLNLIAVFPKESILSTITEREKFKHIVENKYKKVFHSVYYQIDTIEYESDESDMKYLKTIQRYLTEFSDIIEPVLINDSYYIDKDESEVKKYLNAIGRKVQLESTDQYYKDVDDSIQKFSGLFVDKEKKYAFGGNFYDLLSCMLQNTLKIGEECNYVIDVGKHKLPKYETVDGRDNQELFFSLIQEGIERKLLGKVEDINVYLDRIDTECDVIVNANLIDYFLILWDIIDWCYRSYILVGTGRGSVAGSLIAYLLNITEVDPVKYGLLFERFLNKERVTPDVFYDLELENGVKLRLPEGTKIKSSGEIVGVEDLILMENIDIDYDYLQDNKFN